KRPTASGSRRLLAQILANPPDPLEPSPAPPLLPTGGAGSGPAATTKTASTRTRRGPAWRIRIARMALTACSSTRAMPSGSTTSSRVAMSSATSAKRTATWCASTTLATLQN
ncbi:hypothetical protein GGF44_005641, partial [Coemansia sp. RSA 1694]